MRASACKILRFIGIILVLLSGLISIKVLPSGAAYYTALPGSICLIISAALEKNNKWI